MSRKKKMELLAPAGSYETLKAVIEAGADAVYLGGPAFGARAYANNFTQEELLEAIDYAHFRGCRVYLTVNTLLKNAELAQVYDYLLPYYRQGLDGVLVQDFGALALVRRCFPEIEIHTSTQMTVTGVDGIRFLQEYGVSRVVMAREVSLAEMKRMHEETGMELEAFVHGALCYSYSGQCLFSSMLGGRSGNRGRCAQPCRLPYGVQNEQKVPYCKESYCISLKDMCGIEDIRALYEAGVYSLKIEGRMKSPDYAAGVVSIYRKYLDQLEGQKGAAADLRVSKADKLHLSELGSRCGFTDRYYHAQNGADMVTFDKPNLEYRNPEYHKMILERYAEHPEKIRIGGRVTLTAGEPALFEAWSADPRTAGEHYICATGADVMEAVKKPLSGEDVANRMQKTGDSPFVFEQLELELGKNCFLPNGALNQLRREALELLKEEMLAGYRREEYRPVPFTETEADSAGGDALSAADANSKMAADAYSKTAVSVLAETREQMELVLGWKPADTIYADCHLYIGNAKLLAQDLECAHLAGKQLYLALPQIFRIRGQKVLEGLFADPDFRTPDGFLVRNYEELYLVRSRFPQAAFVTDHNLYTYNDEASAAFLETGAEAVTMPLELNGAEIAGRKNRQTEMILYGYYPLMISAQCVHANTAGCDRKPQITWMRDRYKTLFPVKNQCAECVNVIYNSLPTALFAQTERLQKAGVKRFRLQFSVESAEETRKVLRAAELVLRGEKMPDLGATTNGHYKRGVE